MIVVPFLSQPSVGFASLTILSFLCCAAHAFTSSDYRLDTEYSGSNFFDGWDFFTGQDPTQGFVTYYNRQSAQAAELIRTPSDQEPAYIGVDHNTEIPEVGAGRPSVRITSKRSWTHGLFIGDFDHIPAGACGTWPAFWTLGPRWPYTGEIDIMEGVNDMTTNAVSLHTNDTCRFSGSASSQTGLQGGTDCAYHPNDNVGCGVVDHNTDSYSNFNNVGGGVYAMQWTSEYIRVWFWSRSTIPSDIVNKQPNPSRWGIPVANMEGDCVIDQHFQQHQVVFDNTFCGSYAGGVWAGSTCQASTGTSGCDLFVAQNPAAFNETYWSINSVRVYQLVDPNADEPRTETYIASEQPASTSTTIPTLPTVSPGGTLCPKNNFSIVEYAKFSYEIECGYNLQGQDLAPPEEDYDAKTFEACLAGCNLWNNQTANVCGGVSFDTQLQYCYYKRYINADPEPNTRFRGARLIYYGYPQVTDDPASFTPMSAAAFVEIIPVPQTYVASTTTITSVLHGSSITFTSGLSVSPTYPLINSTSVDAGPVPPGMGMTASSRNITIPTDTPTVTFSGTETVPLATSSMLASDYTVPIPDSSRSYSAKISSIASVVARPNPPIIGGFQYAGCRALSIIAPSVQLIDDSPRMSINRCLNDCSGSLYAGVFGQYCLCENSTAAIEQSVAYPNSACNTSCPGDPSQNCGGILSDHEVSTVNHLGKRQILPVNSMILITLYNNTALLIANTTTVSGLTTSASTTIASTAPYSSMTDDTTTTVTSTSTITVYEIYTTWKDYCASCPSHTTELETTLTVLHCGCTEQPNPAGLMTPVAPPSVPMITTTRNCMCGEHNAPSSVVATIPDESSIAVLNSQLQKMSGNFVTLSSAAPPAGTHTRTITHTLTLQSNLKPQSTVPVLNEPSKSDTSPPRKQINKILPLTPLIPIPVIPIPIPVSSHYSSNTTSPFTNTTSTSISHISPTSILTSPPPATSPINTSTISTLSHSYSYPSSSSSTPQQSNNPTSSDSSRTAPRIRLTCIGALLGLGAYLILFAMAGGSVTSI